MNSGIMDVHNLAFRIARGLDSQSVEEYSAERRASVKAIIGKADHLYERSLSIAKELGLNPRNLEIFESTLKPFQSFGLVKDIYQLGRKIGTSHLQIPALSNKLGQSLRTKGLHIPLIIPDYEFLQVAPIVEPGRYHGLVAMPILSQKTEENNFEFRSIDEISNKKESKTVKIRTLLSNTEDDSKIPRNFIVLQSWMADADLQTLKNQSGLQYTTTAESVTQLLHPSASKSTALLSFFKEHEQNRSSFIQLTIRSDGLASLRSVPVLKNGAA